MRRFHLTPTALGQFEQSDLSPRGEEIAGARRFLLADSEKVAAKRPD